MEKQNLLNNFTIRGFGTACEGRLWRNGKYIPDIPGKICFYDEREWRFVPELPEDLSSSRLTKAEFIDKKKKDSANEKLRENCVLKFEPLDIKYIIVQKENEIINIINEIEVIEKYDDDQKRLLCSRVISSKQILEDF